MARPSLESHRTPEPERLRKALEPVFAAVVPPLIAFVIEGVFMATVPRALLFTAAVIVSSWIGGFKSGLGATLLSAMLLFTLIQPAKAGGVGEPRHFVTAGLFLAVGIAISVFHARLKE